MSFRRLGRFLLEHFAPLYVLVSTPERRRYWGGLPFARSAKFLGAVFFILSGAAFFVDLLTWGVSPIWGVLAFAAVLGLLHVAAVMAEIRNPWLLIVIAGLVFLSYLLFHHLPKQAPLILSAEARRRVTLDAVGLFTAMILGYRLFLHFSATEGIAHVKLQTELAFAHSTQATLAPPIFYQGLGMEACGRTLPSDAVGGDLVDLVECDGSVFAYVADVSGHGIAAGVLMGMVKTAVRQGLILQQTLPSLLDSVNRVLPSVKEPQMYATMAGLRFTGPPRMEYAVAGHLPLLHYRREQQDVVRCTEQQFPLGLFPTAVYTPQYIDCKPGDILAIVTDGLTETADKQEFEFGLEGLERLLVQDSGHRLQEILESALAAASRHGAQQDDRTLLLVRMLG